MNTLSSDIRRFFKEPKKNEVVQRSSPRKGAAKGAASPATPKSSDLGAFDMNYHSSVGEKITANEDSDKGVDDGGVDGDVQPSEYELLRLANIARNAGVMKDLGLGEKLTPKPKREPKKKRTAAEPVEPTRRSKRSAASVDYTPAGQEKKREEYHKAEACGLGDFICQGLGDENRPQREREEILEDLASLAEEARKHLASLQAGVHGAAVRGGDETEARWRAEAEARWGAAVALSGPPSWERYVMSRIPVAVPASPHGLLQVATVPFRYFLLLVSAN